MNLLTTGSLAALLLVTSACNSELAQLTPDLATAGGPVTGAPSQSDLDDVSPPAPPPTPDQPVAPANPETAKRVFTQSGSRYVPADFGSVGLRLVLDNSAGKTTGTARIRFTVPADGYPYLLLNASVSAASLDGKSVSTRTITDAEGRNQLLALSASVAAGSEHELDLTYSLGTDQVSYRAGGVGLVTSMADIDSGNFFEDYGPASFEDDQFQLTLALELKGVTNAHRVFTNGVLTPTGAFAWNIAFPSYYNSSSFYLHVTDKALSVRELTYKGLTKTIPITVYSDSASSTSAAAAELPGLFAELEEDYGPFAHDRFIAYISGAGGMEHAGATITSLSALGHELLHSWFGRGVMPAAGRAGWIDEAVASWRDNGYYRSGYPSSRGSVELDSLSLFDRFTPYAAYASGAALLSELDTLFSSRGGLRPLLAGFFEANQRTVVESTDFETFLEGATGTDLTAVFAKYVYGSAQLAGLEAQDTAPGAEVAGTHPPALTREELERLR